MKLLTKDLIKNLPKLGETSENNDPTVFVKFFTPWSHWTWFATEFDGKDIFFGFVEGDYPEWGTFSLKELESITGPMGLKIERDLHFKPKKFSELNTL